MKYVTVVAFVTDEALVAATFRDGMVTVSGKTDKAFEATVCISDEMLRSSRVPLQMCGSYLDPAFIAVREATEKALADKQLDSIQARMGRRAEYA